MNFEYDPAKSASNEEKHGINFEEAQRLWEDPEMITMRVDRKGEFRKMLIGAVCGLLLVGHLYHTAGQHQNYFR